MSALGNKRTFAVHYPMSAKGQKRTSSHSITSSAVARNEGEKVRPSAFAVLKLISNFARAYYTPRFAPLAILACTAM
jgi:hypothetical protein